MELVAMQLPIIVGAILIGYAIRKRIAVRNRIRREALKYRMWVRLMEAERP